MHVGDLTERELDARLDAGIGLHFGAACARIQGAGVGLGGPLSTVYGAFPVEAAQGYFDVSVKVRPAHSLRRYVRPQVELVVDGKSLFAPFPADTPLPLLEWGINYLIAERLGFHLLLHAGVVELNGRAVVMPALPGSGKSTLTAALALRGFRLLSDEFGVVRKNDGHLLPLLRPIALKNESIDVIGRFAPQAPMGPRYPKTRKGTVAHLAPAASAVARRFESAAPGLIVFPRYDPTVSLRLEPVRKARAFGRLAVNSFNYEMLGPEGFDGVARLVAACPVYDLSYSDLDRAVAAIHELASQVG